MQMMEAGLEMMKTYTADDALMLFLCSERIKEDMVVALQAKDMQGGRWQQSFAVRRWYDIDVRQSSIISTQISAVHSPTTS